MERAQAIQLLALDVDGVLTDGHIYMGQTGEDMKAFHVHDGLGIKWLQQSGITVAIITARESHIVQQRAAELSIEHLYQGQKDKLSTLKTLQRHLNIGQNQIAYMGDDLPDLACLQYAGLSLTVPNAHTLLHTHAHWASKNKGGHGAVREACEMILNAQGKLAGLLESYHA